MMNRPERLSEVLGLWAGSMMAPALALGTLIREERIFHARGIYFRAEVEVADQVPMAFESVADSLAQGPALARLSAGLWRTKRGMLPDVLGLAIRFNADPNADFGPQENSQDLLTATMKSLLTLPLAALMSNQEDFLANTYHGAGKYEISDKDGMRLRITPLQQPGSSGTDRYDRIRNAVAGGEVVFQLETSTSPNSAQWFPLVKIRLQSEVKIDEDKVMFWPFRGQNIRPQGFVQFTRPVPYLASQWARQV